MRSEGRRASVPWIRWPVVAAVLALLGMAVLAGCNDRRPVVVGSKSFPESRLLAAMFAVVLEDEGIPVTQRSSLGGTLVAFNALRTGEIDVYPEYTGTGYVEVLKLEAPQSAGHVLDVVREQFARKWQLVWLEPLGFENTYALAMRRDEAGRRHVATLSQLAAVSPDLVLGCSHEFLARQDGYPGLKTTYGLRFSKVQALQHGLAYQALREGKVDVTDVYSTDGKLHGANLQVLRDDRAFFPPYQAAPLAREDALTRHPRMRATLDSLRGRIDNATMQRLNHAVEAEGRDFREVAVEFLKSQGLTHQGAGKGVRSNKLLPFMWERRHAMWAETVQHLKLTGLAMALAVLLGVPAGIVLSRQPRLEAPVLGFANVMQTIPSIALLAFMLPYLGLGERPAIAALFLYALLPILRNTSTGIRNVDPTLVEVGTGMGLRPLQILWLVEVPLASPVIMAGVRTAAVIAIGTATLAAFIGAGGLGDPIVTGLTLNDENMILSGAIPAAFLAVLVDFLLGLLERWVTPRTVTGSS